MVVRTYPRPKEATRITSTDRLMAHIQSTTDRRVRNLSVDCFDQRIVIRGESNTFYVKQLATQAIQTLEPSAELLNEIRVGVA